MATVIKQRKWTEPELRAEGFDQYARKKHMVMARQLPATEAPKTIISSSGDKLIAQVGDMICYNPGDEIRRTLDDYDHWPVEYKIFQETYRAWDEWDWEPSASEQHLMDLGCLPYFKSAEVWAKKLDTPAYLQSLEQERPALVKPGQYVVIGAKGEPYSMGDNTFMRRYYRNTVSPLLKRLRQLFK